MFWGPFGNFGTWFFELFGWKKVLKILENFPKNRPIHQIFQFQTSPPKQKSIFFLPLKFFVSLISSTRIRKVSHLLFAKHKKNPSFISLCKIQNWMSCIINFQIMSDLKTNCIENGGRLLVCLVWFWCSGDGDFWCSFSWNFNDFFRGNFMGFSRELWREIN